MHAFGAGTAEQPGSVFNSGYLEAAGVGAWLRPSEEAPMRSRRSQAAPRHSILRQRALRWQRRWSARPVKCWRGRSANDAPLA